MDVTEGRASRARTAPIAVAACDATVSATWHTREHLRAKFAVTKWCGVAGTPVYTDLARRTGGGGFAGRSVGVRT